MSQWYHLFSLLSVMCMSFGALYIVFNSDYNEVCDYSGTVDSCDERKIYKATDVDWEKKKLRVDWLIQAQELRNQSEKMKCDTEMNLLQDLQDMEKAEAERIVNKCLADFRECVLAGYTTTTPGPVETDCTSCNRFCTMTNWDNIDPSYAIAMGFTGMCSKTVCPWLPECGMGKFIHEKCSMRGCTCDKAPCPTTTPSITTMAPSPTMTGSTSTGSPASTVTTTTVAATTTSSTTVTGSTTTATTSTSTTTTSTTTTYTTSTTTTSTTTTTTSTTITTTIITTTIITTTTTATTTRTSVSCTCPAGLAGTVIVGRPYKTFFQPKDHMWTAATVKLMQGVNVKADQDLPLGGMLAHTCNSYFSDRNNYFGPQQHSDPVAREEARNSHFDLGCGYSGNFNIKCSQTATQMSNGQCGLEVDISTCSPPTFTQALNDCYAAVMTTPPPFVGASEPKVPDWLGVQLLNFSIAELPAFFNITTQTTTIKPCCEVHVGSVCRPDINFDHPLVGKTIDGRWQPGPSYNRSVGYFPVVPCDQQAKSVPRPCPRVKINQISAAYTQWPHCMSVCNAKSAQADLAQMCNRTANDLIETKEEAAHAAKINIQKAKMLQLEQWTQARMPTVLEEKTVIDCFDDRLPRRYNSMSLPKMRSGFSTMPLHNQCRLHGCEVNQCLQVNKKCKVPYVHEPPELMCSIPKDQGQFTCVDKVEISSNNPLSLGFGIAWMVIGALFVCCSIASYVRTSNSADVRPERDTMALANI